MRFPAAWLPPLVLACGNLLRLLTWIATPYPIANDDHFAPVQIILHEGRLPRAEECWSCYQPPLYYVISAAVYRAAFEAAGWCTQRDELRGDAGRKAVQFISTLAGCATLWICLLVVRRARELSPLEQAIALGFVAFLPRHIHMSAMATNDSLAYLLAALAIWAALRAFESGWRSSRVCLAGALSGATVLAKAYGLVTACSVVGVVALFSLIALRGTLLPHRARPALLAAGCAILVGVWPSVINLTYYGRLHVDNFEMLKTGLRNQPPGSVEQMDFLSFRFASLLRYPWSHVSHLDSFWTAVYARLWFDTAGTQNTLLISTEWQRHRAEIGGRTYAARTARGLALRDYVDADTPADFRRVAVASYALGVTLVIVTLSGFVVLLRRAPRDFSAALFTLHFAGCLLIPLVQTLRLPTISAMKAEFMFNNLTSIPMFAAAALLALPAGLRRAATIVLGVVLIGLVICNAAYAWIENTRSDQFLADVFGM